jgi:cob(I)alamin adenosyltransferase
VTRLFTKTGDSKTTGIIGGIRLTKHSFRIEAIGSIDELNASIGFLLSLNGRRGKLNPGREIKNVLEKIQKDLFVIGADLSFTLIKNNSIPHPLRRHYPNENPAPLHGIPKISLEDVHQLENLIDHFQQELPPLKNFILPRGDSMGAYAQVTRTICRRAERRAVQLAMHSKINPLILAYLNRLSDLLFLLSRALNLKRRSEEKLWRYLPGRRS